MGATRVPHSTAAYPCDTRFPCSRSHTQAHWGIQGSRKSRPHRPRDRKSTCPRAAEAAERTIDDVKPAFDRCTTEVEFLQTLKAALNHPKAPDFLFPAFHDFFNNYKGRCPVCHRLFSQYKGSKAVLCPVWCSHFVLVKSLPKHQNASYYLTPA